MIPPPASNTRGIIQRSYLTGDGRRMWMVTWTRGSGPTALPSDLTFETGQAVTLTPSGELIRLGGAR